MTIQNQGDAPVTTSFWVDLYLNPNPPPARVNQVWGDGRCRHGIVWGVDEAQLPFDPGASLTLTPDTAAAEYTSMPWPVPARQTMYVQVDSASQGSGYGAALESHEVNGGAYNNILGPLLTSAPTVSGPATSAAGAGLVEPAAAFLPPRPGGSTGGDSGGRNDSRSTQVATIRWCLLAAALPALAGCQAAEPIPGVRVTVPPTLTIAPTVTYTPGWWETVTAAPTLTGTVTVTATRTMTGTRTPTPVPWREQLAGKIVFVTDRDGWQPALSSPGGSLYLMDADGSHQQPLTLPGDDFFGSGSEAFYQAERERQTWNPQHVWQVYVAELPGGRPQLALVNLDPQDPNRGGHWDLTFHGASSAYDPTWQPNDNWIAYVSDDSGNDEIWKIHAHRGRGSEVQLTHNTWEWDKFPSWSPDGRQIAFYSNRDGHEQIYVMAADGNHQRSLSNNSYDDREPVWLRPLRSGTPTPIPTGTPRAH